MVARLTAAAASDPLPAALVSALGAIGLIGSDGGLDAVTLDRLLLDAGGVVASVHADLTRCGSLAAACATLTGDPRPPAPPAPGSPGP